MSLTKKYTFRPAQRIRRKKEFEKVFQGGFKYRTKQFIINYRANNLEHDRLGLVVSRKLGGAVRRNRIKHKIRELFRTNPIRTEPSTDLVVRPSLSFLDYNHNELERCWCQALNNIKDRQRQKKNDCTNVNSPSGSL